MNLYKHIFDEIENHLLRDEVPSRYLNDISKSKVFGEFPFQMLAALKYTLQSPKHHPEGDVWEHTMLVIDEAAKVRNKSSDSKIFMWAALLHDIGKPSTTINKNGKITSYNHDKVGAGLTKKFLKEFVDNMDFINRVALLVRWHMQILFVVNNNSFSDIKTMKQQVDTDEIALLGLCDRLGRLDVSYEKEKKNIEIFKKRVCRNCTSNGHRTHSL